MLSHNYSYWALEPANASGERKYHLFDSMHDFCKRHSLHDSTMISIAMGGLRKNHWEWTCGYLRKPGTIQGYKVTSGNRIWYFRSEQDISAKFNVKRQEIFDKLECTKVYLQYKFENTFTKEVFYPTDLIDFIHKNRDLLNLTTIQNTCMHGTCCISWTYEGSGVVSTPWKVYLVPKVEKDLDCAKIYANKILNVNDPTNIHSIYICSTDNNSKPLGDKVEELFKKNKHSDIFRLLSVFSNSQERKRKSQSPIPNEKKRP